MGDKKIAFRANIEKGTKVPFQANWWFHDCPFYGKHFPKHKQYKSCDKCGYYNGYQKIVKGMKTL